MTRDDLRCVHEPFGDAFYFGPERLSDRYENNEKARLESGFSESTYKKVLDRIDEENVEVGSLLESVVSIFACYSAQSTRFFFVSHSPSLKTHSSYEWPTA